MRKREPVPADLRQLRYPYRKVEEALNRCHTRGAVELALNSEIPTIVQSWLRASWARKHPRTHAEAMDLRRKIHEQQVLPRLVAVAHDRIDHEQLNMANSSRQQITQTTVSAAVTQGMATAKGREEPWDESRKDFMPLTLAHQRYCTSGTAPRLPGLSKQCKPDGGFDYMRKPGKGVRVDEDQFAAWATQRGYTKESIQKAQALVEAHKKSSAGLRDRLHKEHDVDWQKEFGKDRSR